jgi:lysophospholipase L1-like esterase
VPFHRYVALGDSFAEGVGDPDPSAPNGLRGWTDRVAAVLATQTPDFGYANLAIRGRKLAGVIAEQIEPAVRLEPDLITIYAGANDIMRPKVDIDGLVQRYEEALGRLAATGTRLLVFTAFDPGGSAIYRPLRGRFALYNEQVRWAADRHGATIVDFWRMREFRDWRYWDHDRLHLGPWGHQRMAIAVLDVLGVPHGVDQPELPTEVVLGRTARYRENAAWTRTHFVPWIHRRLTGRSSGDLVSPKRPGLAPVD